MSREHLLLWEVADRAARLRSCRAATSALRRVGTGNVNYHTILALTVSYHTILALTVLHLNLTVLYVALTVLNVPY